MNFSPSMLTLPPFEDDADIKEDVERSKDW